MTETFIDVIRDHARRRGKAIALTLLRDGTHVAGRVSFAELHRRAKAVAATLQARNLEGSRAVLLYPAGIEFVCAFLGCLYSGVTAVPAPPPEPSRLKRSLPRLLGIISDCDPSVILTETSTELLPIGKLELGNSTLDGIETDVISSETHASWQPAEVRPDDLAYLQYTSGSTSNPMGIEISHFNLLYHLRYLQQTCSYQEQSITVTWMPNFHDWGLVEGLLEPIYNGTPCYLMSPISFVRRPCNWLAAITQFGGTHSQGPTFAYEHCLRRIPVEQMAELDLSSWCAAGIGAEPINNSVMRGFYERFRANGFRWTTFSPAYGLGEATLKVSCCGEDVAPSILNLDANQLEQNQAVAASRESANVRTIVSSGSAHGETEIAIVDPETCQRLEDGRVGEIWIRDPAVAVGYWNRKEKSELTFWARLTDGHGPFLRTGDLGFLNDSQLYVTGRLKDVIIVRGSNHYPQDIEWTAQNAHDEFRGQTGAAFSIDHDASERLVLLQELGRRTAQAKDLSDVMSAIVAKVADEHELEVFDVLLLKRGMIPKTASGKVQRHASKLAYVQSQLTPVARWRSPMNRAEAKENSLEKSPDSAALPSEHYGQNINDSTATITSSELIEWLREYAGTRINSLLIDQRRSVPPHIVLDFGNRGIFGLQVPKCYGGLGLSYQCTVRVLEQLAAIDVSLATLVFLGNTNGLRPIINFGCDEAKAQLLPGLAAGRQLAAFALSEPGAGSNIGAIQTKAIRQKRRGWQISGEKRWNGSSWADVITVIAREYDSSRESLGISAFLVRQGTPGLRIGEEALTLGLRGIVQNSLHLHQVAVEEQYRLGTSGEGLAIVNDALSVGRIATAAVCQGGMKRAAQLLRRYARERKISSGILLDHPNTQFQLSEITSRIESIESFVGFLTEGLDTNDNIAVWNEASPLLMMAVKVLASDYFNQTTAWTVQLLGGRGYMESNEAARLLRDARSLSIGEGPNESLLGHLGQAKNVDLISRWLESLDATDLSHRLAETCEDLQARCMRRQDLSPGQRRLWLEYLSGQVAANAISTALVTSATPASDRNGYVADWCQIQLDKVIRDSSLCADRGSSSRPLSSINDAMERFTDDIGDLLQRLPGEDQLLDPLLRNNPTVVKNIGESDVECDGKNSVDTSGERRWQLEKLLRDRILLDDNGDNQPST